ncbi:hypothetical protein BC937DRAFT_92124 [Endogone sp. FLAS-F59071]|nr:hypothetical protein BC937DRAFT_92124 [Endogone sp. FLAS-F59071]|eukprot:RUS15689.1 hypothetical protein BC937DRAFT_92124 [Endogone sp. FLAS-F59071]
MNSMSLDPSVQRSSAVTMSLDHNTMSLDRNPNIAIMSLDRSPSSTTMTFERNTTMSLDHSPSNPTMSLDHSPSVDEDLWIPEEDNDLDLNDTELNDIELKDLDTDLMDPATLADIDEELALEIDQDVQASGNNHLLPFSTLQTSNFPSPITTTTHFASSPVTASPGPFSSAPPTSLNGTIFNHRLSPLSPTKPFFSAPIIGEGTINAETAFIVSAPREQPVTTTVPITTTNTVHQPTSIDPAPQPTVISTTMPASVPDHQTIQLSATDSASEPSKETVTIPTVTIPTVDNYPSEPPKESNEIPVQSAADKDQADAHRSTGDQSSEFPEIAAEAEAETDNTNENEAEIITVPPVLVYYNNSVYPVFDYDPADDPEGTDYKEPLLVGAEELYYGPLGEFLEALRYEFLDPEDDAKEVVAQFPELNLEIAQDSVETRNTTLEELDQLYSSLQQSGHLESADGPLKLVLRERVKFGAQLKRLTALLAEGGAIDNPIVLEDTESSNRARTLNKYESQETKPADGKKPELIVLRDSPEVSEEAGAANGGPGEEEAGSGDLDKSPTPALAPVPARTFPDYNSRRDSYNSQLSGDEKDLIAYEDAFGDEEEEEVSEHVELRATLTTSSSSPSASSKRKALADVEGEDKFDEEQEQSGESDGDSDGDGHKRLRSA